MSQPPSGQQSFSMTAEQEEKYHRLIENGLAESDKVSDEFLNSVDPQLRAMYRERLVAGTRLYYEGLKTDDPQKQILGIQKQIQWIAFWEKNSKQIVDKIFPP